MRLKLNKEQDLQSRRAILWMHPTSMLKFMTSQRWIINSGHLPEDVTFHSVFWDTNRMVWGIVCQSKEFKTLKLGQPMPELPPVEFRYWSPEKDGLIE